ncbi:sulfatase [Flammeovirgaceae bacterium SG7u.111]|nr:sulfatase [Flammeovirgaceae bacterium SG7u.132]WPO35472.1 sulfatase [Flammeovirgaceae bacterium SG7u.111]
MKKTNLFTLVCLAISGIIASCSSPKAEEAPQKQVKEGAPNIVFIFADDLGYGDLGCFGASDIKTPNIDRIASDGIKFTEFYSASPICSPSRAGLLTGRMPQRMGINGVFFPESFTGMPLEEITTADMLKEVGYTTGIVGKWHLGHLEKFLPLQRGFDEYYGIPYSNDMESVVYLEGNEVDSFKVDQQYTTQTYTKKAVDFIDRNKAEPFFLYIAHSMPHVPIYASEKFLGTSERGLYGDVIQELDWSVGEVLKKLEAEGILENTLIVFSSDNGPWLVMEDHGGSAGELREGKQYTFEGGMRVPTVAMWKDKIPAGSVYDDMALQMDWFPTFANLCGGTVPTDRPIDGENISEVLLGKGKRKGDNYLYYDNALLECYRKGEWKVKLPFKGYSPQDWKKGVPAHDTLLVNLKNDPGERINLYEESPQKAIELLAEMEEARKALGELPPSLHIRSGSDRSHYKYLNAKHKNDGK